MEKLIEIPEEFVRRAAAGTAKPYLIDVLSLERLDIDYDGVSQLFAHRDGLGPSNAHGRYAIVAGEDHIFGMARMIELRMADRAGVARAFREREPALAWLLESP